MNQAHFELEDIKIRLQTLKDKISDVVQAHQWLIEDVYSCTADELIASKQESESYLLAYEESRIQHNHTEQLLTSYLNDFDAIIKDVEQLDEKNTLSDESLATESDNA
ncbi:DUF1474 family protein [Staphylococcus sp. Marseille-Q6910]|uniref:type II toxin-antitoxin system toxin TscT n=1 Tax=Staphylococcus sp. Marseille-Q6910 TaxID=2937990 RepID=UPI00203C4AFB|nr:DUF1474 family protein [Staphylococcus sp. Marseille-Q6910]